MGFWSKLFAPIVDAANAVANAVEEAANLVFNGILNLLS